MQFIIQGCIAMFGLKSSQTVSASIEIMFVNSATSLACRYRDNSF